MLNLPEHLIEIFPITETVVNSIYWRSIIQVAFDIFQRLLIKAIYFTKFHY